MKEKPVYSWRVAFSAANEIRSKIEPHCEPEMIKIVGSLRRQCETVHDVDIVICPHPYGQLDTEHNLVNFNLPRILGESWQGKKGKGLKIFKGHYAGIPVDLYFATPDTWWTLVVIRTGSREHNIKLCQKAQAMGMKLHADGSGLDDLMGHVFVPQSEEGLFTMLQLDYVEPKDRVSC
jgi:DNA polymerase/3'-5' exonuclease PolX